MAVIDKYVNSNFTGSVAATQTLAPGVLIPSCENKGEKLVSMTATFEKAAGDSDTSVWRLFKGLPSGLKPKKIVVMCDAISGFTSADLGFYPTDGGLIATSADGDKDILMAAQTLASASRVLDGMAAVDLPDIGKKSIADLLGHSVELGTDKGFYDLALTGNTVGGNAGSVTVQADFYVQ